MMRLPKFERLVPSSLAEATSMLAGHQGEAHPIAGGTDILVSMKQWVITPRYLVDLAALPNLEYIQYDDKEGLRLGPLVKLTALASHPLVQQKYPGISQAAASVGAPTHQFMGTIGGNICLDTRCWYYNQSSFWRKSRAPCIKFGGDPCYIATASKVCVAVFSADVPPVLIALGAQIKLTGAKGERTLALEDFYTGDGKVYNTRQPDEVLSEIRVPPPQGKSSSIYLKFRIREAIDFPVVGVAASVSLEDGKCRQARVVLNAVDSNPVLAKETSQLLTGVEFTQEVINQAAERAYREAKPISDTGGTPAVYRKKMCRVFTRRALEQLLPRLTG